MSLMGDLCERAGDTHKLTLSPQIKGVPETHCYAGTVLSRWSVPSRTSERGCGDSVAGDPQDDRQLCHRVARMGEEFMNMETQGQLDTRQSRQRLPAHWTEGQGSAGRDCLDII